MSVSGWFLLSGATGWAAIILMLVAVLVSYAVRRPRLALVLGIATQTNRPYLERMGSHTWIGYSATALAYVHAFAAMHLRNVRTGGPGLSLAMLAEMLLIAQVLLGLTLLRPTLGSRRKIRRVHFWVMIAVSVAIIGHIAMTEIA